MGKREKLRNLINLKKSTIIERNLYILSSIFLLSTIIINMLTIIYYPYLLNGLILEINILFILLCIYLLIKKQQQINIIKLQLLKLKYTKENRSNN